MLPPEPLEVSPDWGVNVHVFNVNEGTILFLQGVLDEVLALFPSQYIHVGGDECPKREWHASPTAQARMQALGLTNEEELQSYFIRRMDDYLVQRGRRLVGWDEILEGGLAPNAIVMSWRGEAGGIAAAQAGHDVIMASNRYCYFDYLQSEDKAAGAARHRRLHLAGEGVQLRSGPAGLTPNRAATSSAARASCGRVHC